MTHLTGSYTDEELASLTERLMQGMIPEKDIASTISDLGDVHYADAKPVIERHLHHPDEWVRRNAIQALTVDFRAQEHRGTCIRMIAEETDFDVRNVAISGLGSCYRTHKTSRT